MFGNNDESYGGGGFDVSGFGAGDTPQTDKKNFKRTEHLVPVTVRQILQSADTGLKIGQTDMEVQMVKLLGIVKKITTSSVKIIYTLEDNTGSVDGVHWLEADTDEHYSVPVVENTYAVMIGSIRSSSAQHSERHIMVFQIYPVTDLNDLTAHTLQVVYISLKSEDLEQKTQPVSATRQEMSSTYGDMATGGGATGYSASFNLNPHQQRVLKAIAQLSHSEHGASIPGISNALTVKIPTKEIEKILEFLSSEGHIYSTLDNTHYKATDSDF